MSATVAPAVLAAAPAAARRGETGRAVPAHPLAGSGPWLRVETAVAAVVGAVGLLGLITSWAAAAEKTNWRDQLPWMAAGGLFTIVAVLAVVGWVLVGIRRLRAGIRDLLAQRGDVLGIERTRVGSSPGSAPAEPGQLVTAAGMRRAHHPGCLLVRDKTVTPLSPADAEGSPRCGVCRS